MGTTRSTQYDARANSSERVGVKDSFDDDLLEKKKMEQSGRVLSLSLADSFGPFANNLVGSPHAPRICPRRQHARAINGLVKAPERLRVGHNLRRERFLHSIRLDSRHSTQSATVNTWRSIIMKVD